MCVCVCVFVRDNLENGWIDFHSSFLFEHYGSRLTHGLLLCFSKNGQVGAWCPKNLPKQAKCRKNVFVRDNLNNGWMDFDISFFIGTLSILINTWNALFCEKWTGYIYDSTS